MATRLLKMPKLSPTMEKGVIVRWNFALDQEVPDGATLLEVATDKANVEHQVIDGGWLRKLLVQEGDSAFVGQPIALFTDTKDEAVQEPQEQPLLPTPTIPQKTSTFTSPSFAFQKPQKRVIASPLAKKLAHLRGIDLNQVQGSGPFGRIVSKDLPEMQGVGTPLSPMRAVIAKRLLESKTTIPHFYVTIQIEVSSLVALYQQKRAAGEKLTYNDFIIRAVALSLQAHPEVNAGFDHLHQRLLSFSSIDIAIAVSVPGGVLTPIISEADKKTIQEISTLSKELATRAKELKLQPKEYQGGSLTISNLGMFDVHSFTAIINAPQAAILAVAAISQEPVVKEGQIVVGHLLRLTLSADHRVIDGKEAAQFLQTVKGHLQNPTGLL